jgi:hypothetical protein
VIKRRLAVAAAIAALTLSGCGPNWQWDGNINHKPSVWATDAAWEAYYDADREQRQQAQNRSREAQNAYFRALCKHGCAMAPAAPEAPYDTSEPIHSNCTTSRTPWGWDTDCY